MEVGEEVGEVVDGVDGDTVGEGSFGGVFGGEEEFADTGASGGHSHREDAGDRAECAGKGEFAEEGGVRWRWVNGAGGGEEAHEDREVVDGAFFAEGGWGEVDGDTGDGEFSTTGFDSGADAFSGFFDGGVWEADDVEGGQAAGEGAFYGDIIAGDSLQA